MYILVAILSMTILAATGAPQHPAAQYPAGVNPALCPGYPNCDNALLHNPQPHHNEGHWSAPAPAPYYPAPAPVSPYYSSPHTYQNINGPAGNHLSRGDKYPAGVNPHSCPNYPFCDISAAHHAPQVAPLPGWTERQYPAGVSPHECPNFPYCH